MADLKEYTVVIGGVEHTLQLSDEDAQRYGDAATPKSSTASNKSRSASDK